MAGVLLGIPGDWRHRARCTIDQAELFFPISVNDDDQTRKAKAVCARCPVRDECLRWALDAAEGHGVWGGLDEVERRQLRRGRPLARDQHGTVACYDANGCRCARCQQAKAAANRRKRQRRTA